MDTFLTGMLPEELTLLLPDEPAYRGIQLFRALQRGASSFDAITVFPVSLREELASRYQTRSSTITRHITGREGTHKIRIRLHDHKYIEAVLLADKNSRFTACLSTQVGCAMGCVFCKTGSLGFTRNLDAGEIVEQFLFLGEIVHRISNIVFMGMGEPLLNLKNLRRAVAVLHHPEAHNISLRKMTISTCGITGKIRELGEHGPDTGLAVSLNSGDDDVRSRIMPGVGNGSLKPLKEALVWYQKKQNRRITLEYVLMNGVNDRPEDPGLVARFAGNLNTVVNLIPCNPGGNPDITAPDRSAISRFKGELETKGLKVVQRFARGLDINGACGQLGST